MAMPWSLAKAKAAAIRADETGAALEKLNRLFNATFRIQREACEAAGRHVPMVVENVRGAQPWVGPAAWNYGSYYIWGDVPALMPAVYDARKVPGFRFDGSGKSFQTASVDAHDLGGRKNTGGSWFNIGSARSEGGGQQSGPADSRRPQGRGRGMVRSEPLQAVQQVQRPQSRQRQDREDPVRALQPHRARLPPSHRGRRMIQFAQQEGGI